MLKTFLMNWEEFIRFLKGWVAKINNFNLAQSRNEIILDEYYFPRNGKGEYGIDESKVKAWENSEILFIGDNPGKREKDHRRYFFYDNAELENNKLIYSTAGYKLHSFLEKLNIQEGCIVKFNKCLISTNATRDLTSDQIDKTSNLVCEFIRNFHEFFPNTFILFSGIQGITKRNSKFQRLYDRLTKLINQDYLGFIGHICRGKYPKKECKLHIENLEDLKKFSRYYKKMLFSKSDESKKAPIDWCLGCPFKSNCKGGGGDNGEDGGLSPLIA